MTNNQRPDPWPHDAPPRNARPAGTLIVTRGVRGNGADEILMVRRGAAMRFAAGALVFPGGAVDPADMLMAGEVRHGLASADAAARIAAIRETIEEAGLAVGLYPHPPQEVVAAIRLRLGEGDALAPLLAAHGLAIDFAALEPFARWCPQTGGDGVPRIYDTRFYLAKAQSSTEWASPDAGETVALRWASAKAFASDVQAGREIAIFPTRRNLERLAERDSHADLVVLARAHPVEMVVPWVEERDGALHLCIPDHLGYPVTSEPIERVRRG